MAEEAGVYLPPSYIRLPTDAGDEEALSRFAEPGRALAEWSVLLSAVALLFPVCGVLAAGLAVRAGVKRSPRFVKILVAAIWCTALGVFARVSLSMGVLP